MASAGRIVLAAALLIALPAFAFLKWSALTNPGAARPFWNHLALLLAGVFAVLAAVKLLAGASRARQRT